MSLKGIIKGATNRALKEVGALGKDIIETGNERMKICTECDIFDPELIKCDSRKGGCGCYMKTKVLVKEAKCPKSKW